MAKIGRREFLDLVTKSTLGSIWMVGAGGNWFKEARREDKGNGFAEVTVEEEHPYFVSADWNK